MWSQNWVHIHYMQTWLASGVQKGNTLIEADKTTPTLITYASITAV